MKPAATIIARRPGIASAEMAAEVEGSEVVDAWQTGSRDLELDRPPTRSDESLLEGDDLAVVQPDGLASSVHFPDRDAKQQLDPMLAIERLGIEEELLPCLVPAQELLGERGSVIGNEGSWPTMTMAPLASASRICFAACPADKPPPMRTYLTDLDRISHLVRRRQHQTGMGALPLGRHPALRAGDVSVLHPRPRASMNSRNFVATLRSREPPIPSDG